MASMCTATSAAALAGKYNLQSLIGLHNFCEPSLQRAKLLEPTTLFFSTKVIGPTNRVVGQLETPDFYFNSDRNCVEISLPCSLPRKKKNLVSILLYSDAEAQPFTLTNSEMLQYLCGVESIEMKALLKYEHPAVGPPAIEVSSHYNGLKHQLLLLSADTYQRSSFFGNGRNDSAPAKTSYSVTVGKLKVISTLACDGYDKSCKHYASGCACKEIESSRIDKAFLQALPTHYSEIELQCNTLEKYGTHISLMCFLISAMNDVQDNANELQKSLVAKETPPLCFGNMSLEAIDFLLRILPIRIGTNTGKLAQLKSVFSKLLDQFNLERPGLGTYSIDLILFAALSQPHSIAGKCLQLHESGQRNPELWQHINASAFRTATMSGGGGGFLSASASSVGGCGNGESAGKRSGASGGSKKRKAPPKSAQFVEAADEYTMEDFTSSGGADIPNTSDVDRTVVATDDNHPSQIQSKQEFMRSMNSKYASYNPAPKKRVTVFPNRYSFYEKSLQSENGDTNYDSVEEVENNNYGSTGGNDTVEESSQPSAQK